MRNVKTTLFNYAELAFPIQQKVRAATDRIKGCHRRQVRAIIAIGRALAEVKAVLEHGQYEDWIESEFAYTIRTAENYVSAFHAFDGRDDRISYLPLATVYDLSCRKVPEELRNEVVLKSGTDDAMTPGQIAERLDTIKPSTAARAQALPVVSDMRRAQRSDEPDHVADRAASTDLLAYAQAERDHDRLCDRVLEYLARKLSYDEVASTLRFMIGVDLNRAIQRHSQQPRQTETPITTISLEDDPDWADFFQPSI